MSRVIQLCVSGSPDEPDYLYALTEDGRIWLRLPEYTDGGSRLDGRWVWEEVALGPQMNAP